MEDLNDKQCNHENQDDRSFIGTWVSDEIKMALKKNYKIIKVYEIWHYKMEQYDINTKTGGLFTEYIDNFFKLKIAASGFPASVTNESEKDQYIQKLFDVEGISLDKETIEFNAGLKTITKLILNCLWGRFGMRENLPKTVVVKSREHLLDLLSDPKKEVLNIIEANDDVLYVSWRNIDESIDNLDSTNVVIAAYTTAQARLKLYGYLDKLKERVFYFDTDICVYVSKENDEYEPELGNFLGQMTDELETYGRGSYIETFVSGGPKFYTMKIRSPDGKYHYVYKIKGISLDSSTTDKINFESIKSMVLNDEKVTLNFSAIRRSKTHNVLTKTNEQKTCQPNQKKRVHRNLSYSVPYGFKKLKKNVKIKA